MIKLEDIVTNSGDRSISRSFDEYGENISRNDMIPGHYYSINMPIPNFNENWIPNSKEEYLENPAAYITSNQYYNLNPIGLSFYHEKWKENCLLLDLKVIPPVYRSKIVMTHLNLIEKNLNEIGAFSKDADMIPFKDRGRLNQAMYNITPSILEQATGLNLKSAMTGIKLNRVARAQLLDWNNVGEIPASGIDTRGISIAKGLYDISRVFQQFEIKQI